MLTYMFACSAAEDGVGIHGILQPESAKVGTL